MLKKHNLQNPLSLPLHAATKYQLYRELKAGMAGSGRVRQSAHGNGDHDRDRSRSKRPKTAAPPLKAKVLPPSRPMPSRRPAITTITTIDTADFTAAKRAVTGHATPAAPRSDGPVAAADPGPAALAEAAGSKPTLSREALARFRHQRSSAAAAAAASVHSGPVDFRGMPWTSTPSTAASGAGATAGRGRSNSSSNRFGAPKQVTVSPNPPKKNPFWSPTQHGCRGVHCMTHPPVG